MTHGGVSPAKHGAVAISALGDPPGAFGARNAPWPCVARAAGGDNPSARFGLGVFILTTLAKSMFTLP